VRVWAVRVHASRSQKPHGERTTVGISKGQPLVYEKFCVAASCRRLAMFLDNKRVNKICACVYIQTDFRYIEQCIDVHRGTPLHMHAFQHIYTYKCGHRNVRILYSPIYPRATFTLQHVYIQFNTYIQRRAIRA
jgi:hypothetical protein